MPDDSSLPLLTRRAGLVLGLTAPLAVLAACSTSADSTGTNGSPAPAGSAGDGGQVDDQAVQEADLVALYDAVLAAFPDAAVTGLLRSVRDQHAQHLDALGGATSTGAASVPATLTAALTALAATEREASRSRVRACVAAGDPENARVLSLIAASEASHVPALRAARKDLGA